MDNVNVRKLLAKTKQNMDLVLHYIGQILTAKGIKAFLSLVALGLSWLVGWIDQVGVALFALVCSDYLLWFLHAWKNDKISKKKLRSWVGKFLTYWLTIIVGNLLDIVFFHKTQVDYGWRNAFIVYLSINEALSVCKHLINFGVRLPEKLLKKLENYRDDIDYGRRSEDHDKNK